jgi:hypothetical protein
VSSSGLIYAVIVGAWAAYLVPMWLRRQDELNEARPTERFSTAIRLLSGRAAMERRVAKARTERVEPGADEGEDDQESADVVDVRGLAVPATEVRPARAAGRKSEAVAVARSDGRAKVLVRRRRTITLLFLAFTVGAVAAAVGGVAFLWAPAIPAVLLTACIGQMRRQERRRYEVRLDQQQAAEAARQVRARAGRPRAERARHEPSVEPVQKVAPKAEAGVSAPVSSPRTADRRALVEQTDHAEWVDQQRAQQAADDGWDPVPVPLPTYVTAPVAPRTTSGVDLGAPDTWSSARSGTTPSVASPEAATPPAAAPSRQRPRSTRTPLFDQYADPDRPRAANE